MRIWTVKKRTLIIVFCFFLILGILAGLIAQKSVDAAATARKLPVYSVETDEKKIAVTFDAAWTDQDTGDIIEVLKKHNAKATFFIVGEWASKFPESVKAFYDAGHTIANHSDTHKAFSSCGYDEIRLELENCNEKLEGITNSKVTLARAPSGDYTDQSIDAAAALGMTMIQWNVDSLDYTGLSVDEIVNRVVPSVSNGAIILFHNGVDNTAPALDIILTQLEKQGYSFVGVDELIYKENYTIDHTGRQKKLD